MPAGKTKSKLTEPHQKTKVDFNKNILRIDAEAECERISTFIREMTFNNFKRPGAVVGLSGGVDSAVVAALCVQGLGRTRVLGIILPEKESDPSSLALARKQADQLEINTMIVDLTDHLTALGVYAERNRAIRKIFPEFNDGFRFHISLPQDLLERDRFNYRLLTIEDEHGTREARRIALSQWLEISALQNMKQRSRMIQLYRHAEKNNSLVVGTANRLEKVLGYFVKYGDGGVDIDPLVHLYKTQVYQLARHLGVVDEIIARPSSPDTFSLPITHKEFYFCIDYELMDLLLYAYEQNVPVDQVAQALGLKGEQVQRAFNDFTTKQKTSLHLRVVPPSLDSKGAN